jgi:hypothetical protein
MPEITGENTHRATQRGYAAGFVVEEGQAVPAGVTVGSWMEKGKPHPPVDLKQPGRRLTPNPDGSER